MKPTWTKTPPRKEGWYWHQRANSNVQVVHVLHFEWGWGFLEVRNVGIEHDIIPADKWSGPLVPPPK